MKKTQPDTKSTRKRDWSWRQMVIMIALILAAKSSLANWNYVPSGSMQPNLLIGDMIWVNHVAYDLRLPFTLKRIAHFRDPQRGDIVVGYSPQDGTRIVKRVVGLPGDLIEVYGQSVRINNQHTELTVEPESLQVAGEATEHGVVKEALPGHSHTVLLDRPLPDKPTLTRRLARDEYFLMGDHRDSSYDSRYWGPIRRAQIIGRATHIVASLDYQDSWELRYDRFFKKLN